MRSLAIYDGEYEHGDEWDDECEKTVFRLQRLFRLKVRRTSATPWFLLLMTITIRSLENP